MSIGSKIDEKYLSLTKTEKKIANFIVADTDYSIVNMSLQEMSKQLKLGEATIIRFCRKLGFRGFQDLKLNLAIEQSQANTAGQTNEVNQNQVMDEMIAVIHDTNAITDSQRIGQALDLIDTASPIYFYGAGSSGISAEIAENRFLRIGKRCKAIKDSHLQVFQSSIMGPDDLIIALSLSGATADLLESVSIARKNGCHVIAITNHDHSPLALMADCVLLTNSHENPMNGGTIESTVAQLYVLDILLEGYRAGHREQTIYYQNKVSFSISNKVDE